MTAITNGEVKFSQSVKPRSALPRYYGRIWSCCLNAAPLARWETLRGGPLAPFASEILHCRAQYDLVHIHVGGLGHGVGDRIGDGLG